MNTQRKIPAAGLWALAGLILVLIGIRVGADAYGDDKRGPEETVIAGDTLVMQGLRMRLYGIDCPQPGRMCGDAGDLWNCGDTAKAHLERVLTLNRDNVKCIPWKNEDDPAAAGVGAGEATYVCKARNKDLADGLLRGGLCVALPGAFPEYTEAERAAKEGKLGIWNGDPASPGNWRSGSTPSEQP